MLVFLIATLFSIGSIDALVPIILILLLVVAAAGLNRGFSLFNIFGISTLAGINPGGKSSIAGKTAFSVIVLTFMTRGLAGTQFGARAAKRIKNVAARGANRSKEFLTSYRLSGAAWKGPAAGGRGGIPTAGASRGITTARVSTALARSSVPTARVATPRTPGKAMKPDKLARGIPLKQARNEFAKLNPKAVLAKGNVKEVAKTAAFVVVPGAYLGYRAVKGAKKGKKAWQAPHKDPRYKVARDAADKHVQDYMAARGGVAPSGIKENLAARRATARSLRTRNRINKNEGALQRVEGFKPAKPGRTIIGASAAAALHGVKAAVAGSKGETPKGTMTQGGLKGAAAGFKESVKSGAADFGSNKGLRPHEILKKKDAMYKAQKNMIDEEAHARAAGLSGTNLNRHEGYRHARQTYRKAEAEYKSAKQTRTSPAQASVLAGAAGVPAAAAVQTWRDFVGVKTKETKNAKTDLNFAKEKTKIARSALSINPTNPLLAANLSTAVATETAARNRYRTARGEAKTDSNAGTQGGFVSSAVLAQRTRRVTSTTSTSFLKNQLDQTEGAITRMEKRKDDNNKAITALLPINTRDKEAERVRLNRENDQITKKMNTANDYRTTIAVNNSLPPEERRRLASDTGTFSSGRHAGSKITSANIADYENDATKALNDAKRSPRDPARAEAAQKTAFDLEKARQEMDRAKDIRKAIASSEKLPHTLIPNDAEKARDQTAEEVEKFLNDEDKDVRKAVLSSPALHNKYGAIANDNVEKLVDMAKNDPDPGVKKLAEEVLENHMSKGAMKTAANVATLKIHPVDASATIDESRIEPAMAAAGYSVTEQATLKRKLGMTIDPVKLEADMRAAGHSPAEIRAFMASLGL